MDSIRNANLGFSHTPVIGDNTRINRASFYNYISSSEKEASFISSSNLTSIKVQFFERARIRFHAPMKVFT